MAAGEDDVGRSGGCWGHWGCCQTVCYRIHNTDRRTSVGYCWQVQQCTYRQIQIQSINQFICPEMHHQGAKGGRNLR